jgi:hypothetical protein
MTAAYAQRYDDVAEALALALPDADVVVVDDDKAGYHVELRSDAHVIVASDVNGDWSANAAHDDRATAAARVSVLFQNSGPDDFELHDGSTVYVYDLEEAGPAGDAPVAAIVEYLAQYLRDALAADAR